MSSLKGFAAFSGRKPASFLVLLPLVPTLAPAPQGTLPVHLSCRGHRGVFSTRGSQAVVSPGPPSRSDKSVVLPLVASPSWASGLVSRVEDHGDLS